MSDDGALNFEDMVADLGGSLVLQAVLEAIGWVKAKTEPVEPLGDAVPARALYLEHLLPINEMGALQMQLPEGFRMVVTAVWKQLIGHEWSDDLFVGAGWVMMGLDEVLGQLMPDIEADLQE